MSEAKPFGGRVLTIPFILGLLVIIVMLGFLAQRFLLGLGPVSGMNDGYPWGLWIAYDVNVGTAFACGGYAMAILIFIFNKFEYSPLLKPAVLTSFLGYALAGFSIFFDIGRYWNMQNIFLPWHANVHSAMFEVALCIAAYVLVLLIETAPPFLQKLKLHNVENKLSKVLFIFVALGILLPTMHQSSLGSLMVLGGPKMSPLYWSQALPLFFLIGALLLGYAVVIFEATLSGVAFNNPSELKILKKLSAIIPWLVGIFLIVRFQDINARGALEAMFAGDMAGNFFLLESVLLLVALFMLVPAKNRADSRKVFWAAFCALLGAGLYRFDAYIIGFSPGNGWHYFPTTPEILITFGIIAIEILVFVWAAKRAPLLPLSGKKSQA
ncbi:MAG: Ni/Fe-hydrogenase cytochrome b subunit [Desulfohalobiaceae bacterium]|nr:Ni/Fe-hydrogenase cytochrome b subunit [Desulfohalobiaceae bacterium]